MNLLNSISKRLVVPVLVAAMSISLAACGSEKKEVKVEDAVSVENGNISSESKVIAVGDETVTYSEYQTYYWLAKRDYENTYTDKLWGCQVDGDTIGQHAVEDIVRMIIQVKVLGKMAKEKGITIAVDEKQDIDYKADQYLDTLKDDEKVKNNITAEATRKIFEESEVARKMYDVITAAAVSNDSVANLHGAEVLLLKYSADDKNREEMRAQANAAASELKNYQGNFYSFVLDKTGKQPTEEIVGNMDERKNLSGAVLGLGTSKVSNVIEEKDGFYIAYIVKSGAKSVDKKYQEQYIRQQQVKAFQDEYAAQSKRYGVKVSKSLLSKK